MRISFHQIGCVFLLAISLMLTACGFHPRGKINLAEPLQNVFIKTNEPYSQLVQNLKKYLKLSGVHITDSAAEATTVIELSNEKKAQQQLSVSGTQQTRQYNLILSTSFRLLNQKGLVISPPQSVTESRTITIQANQILGGSNEATNLYVLMYQALAYDIMMRLGSQDVSENITK